MSMYEEEKSFFFLIFDIWNPFNYLKNYVTKHGILFPEKNSENAKVLNVLYFKSNFWLNWN